MYNCGGAALTVYQTDDRERVNCAQFSYGDLYFAIGTGSGEIILHSATTNLPSKLPPQDTSGITDVKFTPLKKHYLGSCGEDGCVNVWDINMRKVVASFPQHNAPASGIHFSPVNQLLLASVGLDCKVLFFDTNDRRYVIIGNAESVMCGDAHIMLLRRIIHILQDCKANSGFCTTYQRII